MRSVCWGDLIHPGDRERVWRNVEESVARDGLFESEYRISTKAGDEKWMWTRGRVVDPAESPSDAGARWMEGIIIDVTAEHEAAAMHRELQLEANTLRDRLAQVDRVTMLGQIADGMAHGINQPLSAISMYAQTCVHLNRQTPHKTDVLDTVLEKLSGQTRRAADMVERMRWLGSRTEARFVDADCNLLIADVAQLASGEARLRGIEIDIDLYPEACICNCIPLEVQQVTLHLLRNAISSMCEVGLRNGNQIIISTRCADGRFVVSVTDRGTPVDDERAADLFKPFLSEEGTTEVGLGLSICSAIVSAHRGIMNYSNNAMGGATFYFALPLIERVSP